ncbi:transcriptional regulatory protein [Acrasis kona]|uniref:Transcriptional regulatory protein n=1 Tax=Acrasis kona TaxID=1008807 RepID=A0AAW2Z1L5_9EUKA
MSQPRHSLISCNNCRRQHRRCSKELSGCSLCVARKKDCIYDDTPKKDQPSPEQLEPQDHLRCEILLTLSYYMPILTKHKILHILDYMGKGRIEEQNTDEVAFLHSVHALLTRSTNYEFSQRHLKRAKDIIGPQLDRILDSYSIAVCCLYIGTYYAFENDHKRTRIYLLLVEDFIDYHSKQKIQDIRLACLQNAFVVIKENLYYQHCDAESMFKLLIEHHYVVTELYARNKDTGFQFPPTFFETFIESCDMEAISLDLKNKNNFRYPMNIERIEKIKNTFHWVYDRMGEHVPYQMSRDRKRLISLVAHAAQFQFYIKINRKDLAKHHAQEITSMIASYNINISFFGNYILPVCEFHLDELEHCINPQQRQEVIQRINDDYIAVKKISATSEVFRSRFETLKMRLENTIWLETNNQNLLINKFSNISQDPVNIDFGSQDEEFFLTREDLSLFLNDYS